jgi:flagellin-like hook-associated protein FlgL
MSRIGTLGSHNSLIARMLDTQRRANDLQVQVTTEKKSQTYAGIAADTYRLVSLENQRDLSARFIDNNQSAQTKLNVMENSLTAVSKVIRKFRTDLQDFTAYGPNDPEQRSIIQNNAWEAVRQIQNYLNVKVEGDYAFAGAKTDTMPVQLAWGSLAEFQADYKQPIVSATAGNVTFTNPGTITAANVGAFSGVSAGDTITITGSAANNTTYTVSAVSANGTTLTISAPAVTNEGPVAGGLTIQPQQQFPTTRTAHVALGTSYYYKGDQMQMVHRTDESRTISLGVNAADPAIEKALRGMLMIAQGNLAPSEQSNPGLIGQALATINDSIQHDAHNTSELTSDLTSMSYALGTNKISLNNAIEEQKNFVGTTEARLADLENVNALDAVTRLNDTMNALQTSYTAFGRIRQLSLANYL